MKGKAKTIRALAWDYFLNRPNEEIAQRTVVSHVKAQRAKINMGEPQDAWRDVRRLHQDGFLVQVRKGVYKYDPDETPFRKLSDFTPMKNINFTPAQRREIFARDGYKCVVCGNGEAEGWELHVDHIRPRDKGGKATIENGQTLCSKHNFMKKNLKQTEAGKKMFIRLLRLSERKGKTDLTDFCKDVLRVYKKHDINGHIEWDDD